MLVVAPWLAGRAFVAPLFAAYPRLTELLAANDLTGIRERYYVASGTAPSDLGARATANLVPADDVGAHVLE